MEIVKTGFRIGWNVCSDGKKKGEELVIACREVWTLESGRKWWTLCNLCLCFLWWRIIIIVCLLRYIHLACKIHNMSAVIHRKGCLPFLVTLFVEDGSFLVLISSNIFFYYFKDCFLAATRIWAKGQFILWLFLQRGAHVRILPGDTFSLNFLAYAGQ